MYVLLGIIVYSFCGHRTLKAHVFQCHKQWTKPLYFDQSRGWQDSRAMTTSKRGRIKIGRTFHRNTSWPPTPPMHKYCWGAGKVQSSMLFTHGRVCRHSAQWSALVVKFTAHTLHTWRSLPSQSGSGAHSLGKFAALVWIFGGFSGSAWFYRAVLTLQRHEAQSPNEIILLLPSGTVCTNIKWAQMQSRSSWKNLRLPVPHIAVIRRCAIRCTSPVAEDLSCPSCY